MRKSYQPISTDAVEELVAARGTQPFRAHEFGSQLGCTRQTIYNHLRRLCEERGWEIEGAPKLGFMARKRRVA